MGKIKQATKKTGRERKERVVAQLTEKFDRASGVVFTDYKGITHEQLEDLKKELKALNSSVVIAKNSLIKLSLGNSKSFAEYKDNVGLNLPTATLFIEGDMVEPLKRIQKAIKNFGLPKIKFAVLEGNLTDEAGVLKIASLPNRETLVAQFVGMLNSPISGLVVTLNGTIQKFVMTLSAVAKSKPADLAPTVEVADQTPAETPDSEPISNEVPQESESKPAEEASPTNPPAETDENTESAEAQATQTNESSKEESEGGEK